MEKMRRRVNSGYVVSAGIVVFMVVMLSFAPAYAQDLVQGESAVQLDAGQSDDLLPVWAQDTGEKAGERLTMQNDVASIEKFDLRTDFGRNVVSPVRVQDPFATCWTFAPIAAAETSIAADFGTENVDLSEKHLAWYGMHPLTEHDTDTQVGEGLHVYAEEEGALDAIYVPSNSVIVSSVFSSGVGPLSEETFPYRGVNGLTNYEFIAKHRDKWRAYWEKALKASLGTRLASWSKGQGCSSLDDFLDKEYEKDKKAYEDGTATIYYSESLKDPSDDSKYLEDWRIPAVGTDGESNRNMFEGYTLRDGNLMPRFTKVDENGEVVPNEEGIQAVKQELLRGHGVSCALNADTSLPGQKSESKYINIEGDTPTWAHYTYETTPTNHQVCIVGWDDTYSKDNFKKGHLPPGDGAWIAKNSWGCKDGCGTKEDPVLGTETIGKLNWGVGGSGYFYISYYDRSLKGGESFTFSKEFEGNEFYPNQYDFMPAVDGFLAPQGTDNELISSANVFIAGADQRITSVSTSSDEPNARVTFAMYLLGEDAKDPTDGVLVGVQSCDFKYAGYHRVDLESPFFVRKGQRFSVVSSVKINGRYQVVACAASSKEAAIGSLPYYGVAKVNEGESYYYRDGSWVDWAAFQKTKEFKALLENEGMSGDVIDNFPIKAFGVPYNDDEAIQAIVDLIFNLPEATAVTAADKPQVDAVLAAYEKLSDDAKDAVAEKLGMTSAEAVQARLDEVKVAVGKASDEELAQSVATAIQGLPEVSAVEAYDKDKVDKAVAAFARLSDSVKVMVAEELGMSVEAVQAKLNAVKAAAKEASDMKLVEDIADTINDLPKASEVTGADRDMIDSTLAAFDDLSDNAKALIASKLGMSVAKVKDMLVAMKATADAKYAADEKAAKPVAAAIGKLLLKPEITAADKPQVDAALAAFEKLSDNGKDIVTDELTMTVDGVRMMLRDMKATADAKAKVEADAKAAELAAASNVNKATFTAADAKKVSDLGGTTITLGPKVKKIAKGAFKGTNIKTVVVKTKKLKKKSVKGSLKGSKVKTVKVNVGSKKANKKYKKKYMKIFKKKNSGKKVAVKA